MLDKQFRPSLLPKQHGGRIETHLSNLFAKFIKSATDHPGDPNGNHPMPLHLIIFAIFAVAWRLFTLGLSSRHEIRLKKKGAVEIGATNSLALAGAHVSFYLAAIIESSMRQDHSVVLSWLGIGLYSASALALVSVIRSLGALWTIKIIVSDQQPVVKTGLYRFMKHPNYFFNILPELIGLTIALNAYWTLLFGIPLYLIPLVIRIRQEEKAMKDVAPAYRQWGEHS